MANSNTKLRFWKVPTAEEASFFKKDKPHKKSATSEKTLGIRGQTRIEHYS